MIIVMPVLDSLPHVIDESTCDCNPRIEFREDGEMIIAHNAFDGIDQRPYGWLAFEHAGDEIKEGDVVGRSEDGTEFIARKA